MLAALPVLPAAAAPVGSATVFTAGLQAVAMPDSIVAGPDGNLWFTEFFGDAVGRITPTGTVTEFTAGITPGSHPRGIVLGPDGNLWFAEYAQNRIGRITTSGVVTEFSAGISAGAGVYGIVAGPDGNVWFTEYPGNRIGRITTTGVITEFSAGITAGGLPRGIAAGPDGNLWFTEYAGSRIGRITTTGVVTEFSTGITPGSGPQSIVAGPDGNLWFTEFLGGQIGRITPSGAIQEYSSGLTPGSGPYGIAAGADGKLWFTEYNTGKVGSISTSAFVFEYPTTAVGSTPRGITSGPDGNLWVADFGAHAIVKIIDNFPHDDQIINATVVPGTLTLTTPYTAANPFNLGNVTVSANGKYLTGSAAFPAVGDAPLTITDTRAGNFGWAATVYDSGLTSSSPAGPGQYNAINGEDLGLTNWSVSVPIGSAILPSTVFTYSLPPAAGLAPGTHGAGSGAGIWGGGTPATAVTFATTAHGAGTVFLRGILSILAPTSTVAGQYNGTITFTVA